MVIPQGTIILVDFNLSLGHEQKGNHPAIVISNQTYHQVTNGLVIALPITSSSSDGYPLHVVLDSRTKTQGEVMIEQPKTIDCKARNIVVLETLPKDILNRILTIFSLVTKPS